MKGYANLGSAAGELLGAFMNKDVYRQKGYNESLPKAMQARYYDARTQNELLDAEGKRRAQAVTSDDLIRALGVPDDLIGRVRAGDTDQYSDVGPQIPVDPLTIDKVRRGDVAHTAVTMGGGNAAQILDALLKGQTMTARDTMGDEGRAIAATEGKARYDDGTSGIMNIFTGSVTPTARSQAATGADYAQAEANRALAEQRRMEKEAGGKDPAKIVMAQRLQTMGFSPDEALELALMDSTPTEQYLRMVERFSDGYPDQVADAKLAADQIMAETYGPSWRSMTLQGRRSAAPPPATTIPTGWSFEVEP